MQLCFKAAGLLLQLLAERGVICVVLVCSDTQNARGMGLKMLHTDFRRLENPDKIPDGVTVPTRSPQRVMLEDVRVKLKI